MLVLSILYFSLPTMTKPYPCLNPDCHAEYMQSKSLNHHYACNAACSTFVRDVGSDLQHFGLAASTLQHSTSVGGVDTPHESSDMNTLEVACQSTYKEY
jgi:hypothetical protein